MVARASRRIRMMIEDTSISDLVRLEMGPMIVVCPEIAVEAPLERVALQATAFSNWSGPVFFMGGLDDFAKLHRPWQTDYVNALDEMLYAGCKRYFCGAGTAELASGARMVVRDTRFREACAREGGKVMVTGALNETHVATVAATLLACGLFPIGSSTTIRASEIRHAARVPTRV
jgi:hypothetical protein